MSPSKIENRHVRQVFSPLWGEMAGRPEGAVFPICDSPALVGNIGGGDGGVAADDYRAQGASAAQNGVCGTTSRRSGEIGSPQVTQMP